MDHTIKRRIATAMNAVGLGRAAFHTLGFARRISHPRRALRNLRLRRAGAPDGLPIPPDRLLYLISGDASVSSYLAGRRTIDGIRSLLAEAGRPVERMSAILDFGCGCGRVLRHWNAAPPAAFGCDYSRDLVQWCQGNLPHAKVTSNDLLPPLPYESASFDLVYAISVFTHMPAHAQRQWLAEMRRVLRPNGVLLATFHGSAFMHLLTEQEAAEFARGAVVVTNAEYNGTNVCASFNPAGHVRNVLASDWDVLLNRECGGSVVGVGQQDVYLLSPTP